MEPIGNVRGMDVMEAHGSTGRQHEAVADNIVNVTIIDANRHRWRVLPTVDHSESIHGHLMAPGRLRHFGRTLKTAQLRTDGRKRTSLRL
jgi:FAD/FMN-containing dehydrogenase